MEIQNAPINQRRARELQTNPMAKVQTRYSLLNPGNEVPQKECLEGQGHSGHSPQGHMRHPPAQTKWKRHAENAPPMGQTRVQREYPPKAQADWVPCQVETQEEPDTDS